MTPSEVPLERDRQAAADLLPHVRANVQGDEMPLVLYCSNCGTEFEEDIEQPADFCLLAYRAGWRIGHFWGGGSAPVCPECVSLYTLRGRPGTP